jgi:PAS domain S-box-containing protein
MQSRGPEGTHAPIRRFDALSQVVLAVNQADDLQAAMREVLHATLRAMDFDCGGIYVVDTETRTARVLYHEGLPPDLLAEVEHVEIDAPAYKGLFVDQQPLFLEHFERLRPERALRWEIASMASVPLLSRGETVGALNVANRRRHGFSPEERDLLVTIGREAGFAISRAQADERLRKSEANLAQFFASSRDMLIVADESGRILAANPAVERRLGYSAKAVAGMSVQDLHPAELRAEVELAMADMLAGSTTVGTLPLVTSDGRRVPAETRVSRGAWGGRPAIFASVRDVSTEKLLRATIQALAAAGSARDRKTAEHERRVARLAEVVAVEMGLPDDRVAMVALAASVHDIGKAAVPPGEPKIGDSDAALRRHPEVGQQILRPLEDLGPIPTIVRQHHERPDGGGYPDGLRGEEILLEARIVAVADLVEHLVPAGAAARDLRLAETAAFLERQRGIGFDAEVVDALFRVRDAGLLELAGI